MKAAILQSSYLPWLGFFNMVQQSDVFVFFDDVQWTTRDWRNRNRIRTPQGWTWLTVPVRLNKSYFEYRSNEVEIDYSQPWQKKHLGTFSHCYAKSPFFNQVYPMLENIVGKPHKLAIELNYDIVLAICDYLGLKKRFLYSQDMCIPDQVKKSERLLAVLEKVGGITEYISGPAAKNYLEEDKFKRAGIAVSWHEYHHPFYAQNTWHSGTFISYLSIVDLLFNHGPASLPILTGQTVVEKPAEIKVQSPEASRQGVAL